MAEKYVVLQASSSAKLQNLLNMAAKAGYMFQELQVTRIAPDLTFYTAVMEMEESK